MAGFAAFLLGFFGGLYAAILPSDSSNRSLSSSQPSARAVETNLWYCGSSFRLLAMYLLFLDESGTPPKPEKAAGRYLVIGGVIIPEGAWQAIAKEFKKLMSPLEFNVNGEIKWKYFGTGNNTKDNPLVHLSRAKKDSLREAIFKLITSRKAIKLICCVTCVEVAFSRPTISNQTDVYHLTYKGVTERFQYFLQDASRVTGQTQYGLIVSDHRQTCDDQNLRKRHHELIEKPCEYTYIYANIVETIFFAPSEATVGLQLADMVAGAVHRSFQYGEHRFAEMIRPAMRSSPMGDVNGWGLVKMPKGTFINSPKGSFV